MVVEAGWLSVQPRRCCDGVAGRCYFHFLGEVEVEEVRWPGLRSEQYCSLEEAGSHWVEVVVGLPSPPVRRKRYVLAVDEQDHFLVLLVVAVDDWHDLRFRLHCSLVEEGFVVVVEVGWLVLPVQARCLRQELLAPGHYRRG